MDTAECARAEEGRLLAALWPRAAKIQRNRLCWFPGSASLTSACFPVTAPPRLRNVFGGRHAGCRWCQRQRRIEVRRKGNEERERGGSQRAGGVERGSRLPSAKDSLTVIWAVQPEACPETFLRTDFTPSSVSLFFSFSLPLSPQYLPLLPT